MKWTDRKVVDSTVHILAYLCIGIILAATAKFLIRVGYPELIIIATWISVKLIDYIIDNRQP